MVYFYNNIEHFFQYYRYDAVTTVQKFLFPDCGLEE